MDLSIDSTSSIHIPPDISSLDLETALLLVQTHRVQLMDKQIQTQLNEVQARNNQISKTHDLQTALSKANAIFTKDSDATDGYKKAVDEAAKKLKKDLGKEKNANGKKKWTDKQKEQKCKEFIDKSLDAIKEINEMLEAAGYQQRISDATTKGELTTLIEQAQGDADKASNSQQLDMVRLQGLSGKRNEAFDVMTNFIKKLQDSRSAIISNMR